MGPLANHPHPANMSRPCSCGTNVQTGKTERDHKSGKHARHITNKHRDPIREAGGKQGKVMR